MKRPPPIETRLLGLTPGEYQQLKHRARHEAVRLRGEAIGACLGFAFTQVARLLAPLRQRPQRPPVRTGLQPCQP